MGAPVAERLAHLTQSEGEKARSLLALCEEAQRAVKALDEAWELCKVPDLHSSPIAGAELCLNQFWIAVVTRMTE